MSQNSDNWAEAVGIFRSVARRAPDDAWDNDSCCSGWTAREVAGHATWVIRSVTSAMTGGPGPEQQPEAEVVGDDPATAIGEAVDAAIAALDGADLSAVVPSPFGEMPLDDFLGFIFVDPLSHAWDVADATGVDHGISDEMAHRARAAVEPLADSIRQIGGFGPPCDEPDGDPVGAFMAFTGRTSVGA